MMINLPKALLEDVRVVEVSESERKLLAQAHSEFTEEYHVVVLAAPESIPLKALASRLEMHSELTERVRAAALRALEFGVEDSFADCARMLGEVRSGLVHLKAGVGKSDLVAELSLKLAELEEPLHRCFRATEALVTTAALADLDEYGVESATSLSRRLIDALLVGVDPPSPHALMQARANAQARADLIREFGAFSSADVAEMAGSRAKNRAALANRWESEGRVISVDYSAEKRYPSFQFGTDGKPLGVVEEVARVLGQSLQGWELAMWFVTANGWLGGRRPVDMLTLGPEEVVEAAEHGAAELVF